jgi:hypothetical protein
MKTPLPLLDRVHFVRSVSPTPSGSRSNGTRQRGWEIAADAINDWVRRSSSGNASTPTRRDRAPNIVAEFAVALPPYVPRVIRGPVLPIAGKGHSPHSGPRSGNRPPPRGRNHSSPDNTRFRPTPSDSPAIAYDFLAQSHETVPLAPDLRSKLNDPLFRCLKEVAKWCPADRRTNSGADRARSDRNRVPSRRNRSLSRPYRSKSDAIGQKRAKTANSMKTPHPNPYSTVSFRARYISNYLR